MASHLGAVLPRARRPKENTQVSQRLQGSPDGRTRRSGRTRGKSSPCARADKTAAAPAFVSWSWNECLAAVWLLGRHPRGSLLGRCDGALAADGVRPLPCKAQETWAERSQLVPVAPRERAVCRTNRAQARRILKWPAAESGHSVQVNRPSRPHSADAGGLSQAPPAAVCCPLPFALLLVRQCGVLLAHRGASGLLPTIVTSSGRARYETCMETTTIARRESCGPLNTPNLSSLEASQNNGFHVPGLWGRVYSAWSAAGAYQVFGTFFLARDALVACM